MLAVLLLAMAAVGQVSRALPTEEERETLFIIKTNIVGRPPFATDEDRRRNIADMQKRSASNG